MMAAAGGNCFDGSKGRDLFSSHGTLELPADWLSLRSGRKEVSNPMALWALTRALRSLSLAPPTVAAPVPSLFPVAQMTDNALLQQPSVLMLLPCRPVLTSVALNANFVSWKSRTKYTITPVKKRKSGGRDHTGRIRVHGIGGGHRQRYRMIDFLRFRPEETNSGPFEEKVIQVRYDPCRQLLRGCGLPRWSVYLSLTLIRSADIALVAGGNRKRWIIATENMQAGDKILNSNHIGRMAVAAREGDAHPLGALPVGTLVNNVESEPGRGAQYIRAAGTCGVLLRKVNGTAIIQLPSKRQMQVLETCVATVGRVSNVDHNKRVIGKAGRNRWLGKRPNSGRWHRKGGWAGRKIRPLPPMKSYVKLPSAAAQS
ncbi:39S ribosomal protein L2, mitochondrial [Plecturocebus cupreus]